MAYSIVVRIPDPEDTVFVAVPFSRDFRTTSAAIEQAVVSAGLTPRQTAKTPEDTDFIRDITRRIRAARIVVAVCSPVSATGQANPNVMFELGFAQSIGKSTIILTTHIQSLPADLRSQNVFPYRVREVTQEPFISRLANRIHGAKERTSNLLTDTCYPDVWVASARHWMLVNPGPWEHFVTILSFAKKVHHYFQDLDMGHVDHLHREVEDIYTRGAFLSPTDLRQKEVDCQKAWANYVLRYANLRKAALKALQGDLGKVAEAFEQLLQNADPAARSPIERSKEFYADIETLVSNYPRFHDEIDKHISTFQMDLGALLRNPEAVSKLWPRLGTLSATAKSLTGGADSLISNLIEVIL